MVLVLSCSAEITSMQVTFGLRGGCTTTVSLGRRNSRQLCTGTRYDAHHSTPFEMGFLAVSVLSGLKCLPILTLMTRTTRKTKDFCVRARDRTAVWPWYPSRGLHHHCTCSAPWSITSAPFPVISTPACFAAVRKKLRQGRLHGWDISPVDSSVDLGNKTIHSWQTLLHNECAIAHTALSVRVHFLSVFVGREFPSIQAGDGCSTLGTPQYQQCYILLPLLVYLLCLFSPYTLNHTHMDNPTVCLNNMK